MGCDVHAYVETLTSVYEGREYWSCLVTNAGHRDYAMFGIMAGVRVPDYQLFAPRGLPPVETLSIAVRDAFFLRVTDDFDGDRCTTTARANDWISSGGSEKVQIGSFEYVSDPDMHSCSTLTKEELAQCLGHYTTKIGLTYDPEWAGILAMMRALEEHGQKTRLVIGFDN